MKMLVVVDMQNDFIDGALGTKEAVNIVENVKNKIAKYKENGDTVIYTRDTHQENYLETNEGKKLPVVHCIEGTKGWEIADGVDDSTCWHIDKPNFGWTGWKDLDMTVIDEIELVGLCTDICVVSNALILKATYPEIELTVDASCCAGVNVETHKAALMTMKTCQVNVINE